MESDAHPLAARESARPRLASDPGIVGRELELDAIDALLSAAQSRGASLVLEGEPGIGKTTLWRAGVVEAHRREIRVLACSPGSSETRLSFSALGDLLGDALAEVSHRLPDPQRRALEVALLLEEPSGEAAEQRTVAAATLTALRELARDEPLLLAIDDVQWLDEPSEAALGFAARRLGDARVSILAARRLEAPAADQPALEVALEHRHGDMLERVRIGPLSAAALHAVIQGHLGVAFPPGTLERLHATSGGTPFYALELARALMRRSEPLEPGSSLPVPETLQDLVRERLDALPAPVQDLLAVVAAMSHPTIEIVAAAGAGGAVDEALSAQVLELEEDGRLRFAHPFLASTASGRLGAIERRALHGRLAALVDGEERARHLALAAAGPSEDVAAALHEAARGAAGRGAIGAAAALSEEAVRLTPPAQADELTGRRLDAAGYAMRNGDTGRARAHLEPLLAELPAGPTRAGALLRLARLEEHRPARALEACRQAIEEAGTQGVRAAEAHQLAAEMSMLSGDVPTALEHARMAATLAEGAGETAILIESLGTLCHYETYTGSITPGLIERAVELERRAARPSNNYSPREILGLRLMYADRLDEARELLEASYAATTELGDELDRGALLIHLTQLECRAGRLAAADRHAQEAAVVHEQTGMVATSAFFVTALAGAHLGRVDEARAAAEEGTALAAAGGSEVFRILNLWALGFLELSLDDAPAADRHLHSLPESIDAMGYWNPGVRPVYADAIEARIGAGDSEVDAVIDELEHRGEVFDNPWARAAAARCRGLLLAARRDLDGAIRELESALLQHEHSQQPLERGRTLLALGSVQRRAKRRGAARATLLQALECFDHVGATLWRERAAAELVRVSVRTPSAGELTETERQVAELVAQGLSNKAIATKLFITARTVEANLSKVYAKLGIHSRTELASRLGRQSRA